MVEHCGLAECETQHGWGVGVHDHLAGYVWSTNIGWIKLSSGGSGPHTNTTSSNWGVNKATDGSLSGYGWSTTAGWINFGPSQGGVSIANNNTILRAPHGVKA